MSVSQPTILVVDDDPALRQALSDTLELAGYGVACAEDGKSALSIIENSSIGMVISDVQMRPMDGNELLSRIKAKHPGLPVVLMTAYGNIEKAVTAMREGAVDYLAKPFDPEALLDKVSKCVLREDSLDQYLIVDDLKTRELMELARRVAKSNATVSIGGESGTGKEVFARFIHRQSPRQDGPFVAINCGAIPDNMLESMLFGY